MSNSINKTTLLGNLGKDPEVRSTGKGDKVASFSVATTDRWKNDLGEYQERTEWHRVVVFGPLANTVEQYVKKGDKIYVEGKNRTRKWTDSAGVEKSTTEVVISGIGCQLIMLGRGRKDESFREGEDDDHHQPSDSSYSSMSNLDDDIPF